MARLVWKFDCLRLDESPRDSTLRKHLDGRYILLHASESRYPERDGVFKLFGKECKDNQELILSEDCNPWLALLNYNIAIYFGEDKPILKTKEVKTATKMYKRWNKSYYSPKYNGSKYSYLVVKEPRKLFIFSNTYRLREDDEVYESSEDGVIFKLDYSQETFDRLLSEKKRKEEEEYQRYQKELKEREENKKKPGHCRYCGSSGASFVANPYDSEMTGRINMEWICGDCYSSLCGDI